MKKPLLAAALAAALVSTSGCGVVMRYMGDFVANAMTSKTADLSAVAARISYSTNMYPKALALTEHEYYGENWRDGANMVMVNLVGLGGVGLFELDGSVGIIHDAKAGPVPMVYGGKGSYYAFFPSNDRRPKTVVLQSVSGQQARFQVTPADYITLRAINGKPAANAVLDLNQDVVLDLNHPKGAGGMLKVGVVIETMGVKAFSDVGIFKHANRLVIPKEAFRHLQISGSHSGFVHIRKGASAILVERISDSYPAAKGVGAAHLLSRGLTWAQVNVVGDAPAATALSYTDTYKLGQVPVKASVFKPTAFYARPLTGGKTFGLASLRSNAKLVEIKTTESATAITTITTAFPPLPDEHWNRLLAHLDRQIRATVQKETGNRVLPVQHMAKSQTFRTMPEPKEQAASQIDPSRELAIKVLPGSRQTFTAWLGGALALAGGGMAGNPADTPLSKVLDETGTDGILMADLYLQVGANDKGNVVLYPRLQWSLLGGPHGTVTSLTHYGGGSVEVNEGVPFNGDQLRKDPNSLIMVASIPELMTAFGKSLRDMREKEKAAGYDKIWQHQ